MAGVFEVLESRIDLLLSSYVTTKSAALISAITPVISVAVTIYLIVIGFAVIRGAAQDTLHTVLWKCFKIVFVAGLALSAGEYQSKIVNAVDGLQSGLLTALVGAGSLGQLADTKIKPLEDLWNAAALASMDGGLFPRFQLLLVAIVVIAAAAIVFPIGVGMYLLAKVALTLALAVGPVFIVCSMFPATQRFTESWIGVTLSYVLSGTLVASVYSFATDFMAVYARQLLAELGTGAYLVDTGAMLIVAICLCIVLLNVNTMAAALTGGASVNGVGGFVAGFVMNKVLSSVRGGEGKGKGNAGAPGGDVTRSGGSGGGGRGGGGGTGAPLYRNGALDSVRNSGSRRS